MTEKILTSWKEVQEEFNQFNPVYNNLGIYGVYDTIKDFSIFRGHKEQFWVISPTLERKSLKNSIDNIVFEFVQKVDLFENDSSKDKNNLEIFSLMRHYGVPSPLVDFTFSPYIALFFAFYSLLDEEYFGLTKKQISQRIKKVKQNYCVVYSLNYYLLNKLDGKEREFNYEKYLINSEKEFNNFYYSKQSRARAFLPNKYNKRISSQQGLFLCLSKGNGNSMHEELLNCSEKIKLIKYKIPQSLTPMILFELNKMNINHSTMFPSIEGLAAHIALKEKIRVLNRILNEK